MIKYKIKYNKLSKRIIETIRVIFDEWTESNWHENY